MSATSTLRIWLVGLAFLAAYVALDFVSYVKPYRDIGITPWNPPVGLAVAVIFLEGIALAPFVLLAPFVADLIVRETSVPLLIDLGGSILIGGTFVAAGLALQRITHFDPRFRTVRDVLTLVGVAAVTALVSAGILVVIYLTTGLLMRDEVSTVGWRSAVGDMIGILTLAPVLLLWRTHKPWPSVGPWMPLQVLAILTALLLVFGYHEATAFQLFYLLFLPVLWVALSYGPPGAAVALVLVQIGIVIGAEIRFGPDPGFSALQVLMIALAITGLIVGAIVAEREDAAARLRDQQAALNRTLRFRSAGEIAATIAHEINQPLTALATYGGIAAKALREGDDALAARAIAKVESESQRAASVLTGIRELLRQGALNKSEVDVDKAFQQIGELLRADLAKRGVTLSFEILEPALRLKADPIQLQQALHNMVVNAAEAIESMGRRGCVAVRAERPDVQTIRIDVMDDGPGFPPAYDVNDPPPFTSTKADGSGIGLTVVRSIAEAHGGKLSIRSAARGATVSLQLPTGDLS
ncbi:MAG: histidine kinase [Hyphomicrobium sp. 32-62-53]|nr:MAG: histidine kinase [Hyphomicrobium sp. 12-62-95]OYX99468.1 MAG: histidine kinase [Hyphomicrobium sp. 32-62-53]